MTFSILARDPVNKIVGGAVATGNLAVGSRVLNAVAGVGIVATQGYSGSTLWADAVLKDLTYDIPPNDVLEKVVNTDKGRDRRQIAVLDWQGRGAVFTGKSNLDAKHHQVDDNLVVAGNWLVNPQVVVQMRDAFVSSSDTVLAVRLINALIAAADIGGDSRGVMSAAVKVVSLSSPATDLRIDYAKRPIHDLLQLYERTLDETYQRFLQGLPTPDNPHNC